MPNELHLPPPLTFHIMAFSWGEREKGDFYSPSSKRRSIVECSVLAFCSTEGQERPQGHYFWPFAAREPAKKEEAGE